MSVLHQPHWRLALQKCILKEHQVIAGALKLVISPKVCPNQKNQWEIERHLGQFLSILLDGGTNIQG